VAAIVCGGCWHLGCIVAPSCIAPHDEHANLDAVAHAATTAAATLGCAPTRSGTRHHPRVIVVCLCRQTLAIGLQLRRWTSSDRAQAHAALQIH